MFPTQIGTKGTKELPAKLRIIVIEKLRCYIVQSYAHVKKYTCKGGHCTSNSRHGPCQFREFVSNNFNGLAVLCRLI